MKSMIRPFLLIISLLLAIVVVSAFLLSNQTANNLAKEMPYIGIAFGGDTVDQAIKLIDRTKTYTNLFILQSGPISNNSTAINQICNYAVTSGLSIIVYFGDLDPKVLEQKNLSWRLNWIEEARTRYGERFLGVYYYDERGGIYLDSDKTASNWHLPSNATYDSVAEGFERGFLEDGGTVALKTLNVPIFCSDYALYWFDYRSGYDVVLAQIGWNHTLAKDIGLIRGAANVQQRDWGVILTWKYSQEPYIDTGEAIYEQMRVSFETGAKYIAVFNYPYNGTYGIMTDEHFAALQKLWNNITRDEIVINRQSEAALVLPKNYGFGFRYPGDKIWGFWEPDQNSPTIYNKTVKLLGQYSYSLDIVYDDPSFVLPKNYQTIYYWNSTQSK